MKIFLTLLFLASTFLLHSQKPTDKRLAGLDTLAQKVLKDWNAPGISIAVVEKGKIIYAGGFGYRDYENKLPVTANTQFAIGSCTKAFTASLLGMLAQQGKIDLDKPVRNYLPELKFQNEYTNAHATTRDMMCHRTGLGRHDISWYGSNASRQELLERIQYLEPSLELRQKFQYNNFMFMAQGVLVEKLTGKSWEQNIKEKILDPLGMTNTNLSVKEMEKATDHSFAYINYKDSVVKKIPYRNIDGIGPAGSINSTANDMAKWLITWINGGKFEGKEIIPASFVNEATVIQMATGGGLPGKENPDIHLSGYGLGWGMSSYRGHYRVEHGGGIDGFISTTSFFPSDSIGIYVVSNQGDPSTVIRNFIADRMLNLPVRPWRQFRLDAYKKGVEASRKRQKSDSTNQKQNTQPTHPPKDFTGTYTNKGYGDLVIVEKEGKLTSSLNTIPIKLEHYHFNQFKALPTDPSLEDMDGFMISFHIDEKGNIGKLSMPLEQGVKDIEFEKKIKTLALDKSVLDKYIGNYELAPGAIAKMYIKSDSTLYAFIEGQPEYELVATEKHLFDLKALKGFSVKFEEDAAGNIISVSFIQPNGVFKAVKKKD